MALTAAECRAMIEANREPISSGGACLATERTRELLYRGSR